MTSDVSWVVDASVALKWYLEDEDHVEDAVRMLDGFVAGQLDLTAPSFIRYEMANALEVARVQGRISGEESRQKLSRFLATKIFAARDDDALIDGAVAVSSRYGISPYDGIYLAMAEESGSMYVTADALLYRRIESVLPFARLLANVDPR